MLGAMRMAHSISILNMMARRITMKNETINITILSTIALDIVMLRLSDGCHVHDTQHNNTQHDDNQNNKGKNATLSIMILSIIALDIVMLRLSAGCHAHDTQHNNTQHDGTQNNN